MAFEGSSPSDGNLIGNSLMVERYIVTIKMWVQFPFTTKLFINKKKWSDSLIGRASRS